MMNEQDAVNLLKRLERSGIDVWIDGGWGVDALVGHQTRQHNDIDIFVEKKNAQAVMELFASQGFQTTEMEYTTEDHTAWCDSFGHIIDLHLFAFQDKDTVCFEDELYPSDILTGEGIIGGVSVRCLSAEAQLQYHQGYEHDENDVQDVRLLCKMFGLPVPEEYEDECQ